MVTSAHPAGRSIIDTRLKELTTDNGMPELITTDGLKLLILNKEQGIVGGDTERVKPEVGAYLEIIPSLACTTVNLHDRYYVIEDGQLVDIKEINGRGKSQQFHCEV